jgi:hypothetical protein
MFYLIDLERSNKSGGSVFYWKAHKRGYTSNLAEAGLYSLSEALEIQKNDLDDNTLLLPKQTAERYNLQELA